jgi:23S rRNA (cytosine1962-C5)-methyltransferase
LDLSQLPRPSEKNIAIYVRSAAEKALHSGHPWIFESAIREQSREGQAGDLAIIFDHKKRFLAVGLYDPNSIIRVKILQHKISAKINQVFFHDKFQQASVIREPLLKTDTNGYRLVHGENDGLPNLIIDRYADVLVIKLYSAAWFAHLRDILAALENILPAKTIILRLSRAVQENETFGLHDGCVLKGELPDSKVQFRENGLTFSADVIHGHKTGFFFDQRDNRQHVGKLAQGKTVLDVFSYNGGFSVYAAAGGAKSVTSLDISEPALASARDNMLLNIDNPNVIKCEHETIAADAFESLKQLSEQGRKFDILIVDPPSFANSKNQIEGALRAYSRLTQLSIPLVAKGGILVIASCSSRVSANDFFKTITQATRRPLQEIERTQHAIDHPIAFPEGAYLKCLFANVP